MIAMPFPWVGKLKGKGESDEDYTGPPVAPTWTILVPVTAIIAAFNWLFCNKKSNHKVKK